MAEPERGYREEKPLADLIPPDRRRRQAALTFIAGAVIPIAVIAGVFTISKLREPAPTPPVPSIVVGDLSESSLLQDRVSPKPPGPLSTDERIDQAFDVEITGDVVALELVTTNIDGAPDMKHQWSTSALGEVPIPRPGFPQPSVRWQLGVEDLGHGPRNEPDGSLIALGPGRHHVRLFASDAGSFKPDHWFRLYALHRDGSSGVSPVYRFTGEGPPAPPAVPPSPPAPLTGARFDRGAAAAALGGVSLVRCKTMAGDAGSGHVTVVFMPDGTVATAVVDQGPDVSTPRGGCVAAQFRSAKVPPFSGAPVRVGKSYSLDAP